MSARASSYLEEDTLAPLSRDEERALARHYRDHGDAAAAQRLVRSHQRFVYKVAHSFRGYGLRFEDLVQEGNIGLLQAVERFDPDRGHRLISYAVHWIRAQMQAYVVQQHSLVRIGTSQVQRKLFYRLRRAQQQLEQEEGEGGGERQECVDDVLAGRLEVSSRSIREMRKRLSGRDVSIDAPVFHDSARSVGAGIASEVKSPEEQLIEADLSARVRERMPGLLRDELDERERYIIDLRLMQDTPWTLEAIGRTLGITRERTRQLEARAKSKLRNCLQDLVA